MPHVGFGGANEQGLLAGGTQCSDNAIQLLGVTNLGRAGAGGQGLQDRVKDQRRCSGPRGVTLVPVPCASMYSRDSGATPAGVYRDFMSSSCTSPEGNVTPAGKQPQHRTPVPNLPHSHPYPGVQQPTLFLVPIRVGASIEDGGIHPRGQGLLGQQHCHHSLGTTVTIS